MNRRESVEFVNMCMIKNGDKVLVQDRVNWHYFSWWSC